MQSPDSAPHGLLELLVLAWHTLGMGPWVPEAASGLCVSWLSPALVPVDIRGQPALCMVAAGTVQSEGAHLPQPGTDPLLRVRTGFVHAFHPQTSLLGPDCRQFGLGVESQNPSSPPFLW